MALTRQVALIPAGCQPWYTNVATASGKRFAYAATLAIYIYELNRKSNQFYLHSVMSEHKKTISAVTFHPISDDILASCSTDMKICVWHIAKHQLLAILSTSIPPTLLAWYSTEHDCLAYSDGKDAIFLWKFKNVHEKCETLKLGKESSFISQITQFAWHRQIAGHLALGHVDGSISLFIQGQKAQLNIKIGGLSCPDSNTKRSSAITTLLWDPFSSNYLLVSTSYGCLQLLDTATRPASVIATYTTPSKAVSIKCSAWLSEAPGVFVSGDAETGVLRIWSVSTEKPIENLQLKQVGFQTMCVIPSENLSLPISLKTSNKSVRFSSKIVCLFLDGGVGVYNLKISSWEFFKNMGHLETIFDCQFRPAQQDCLATGSFDGTIKVWDVNTMDAVYSSPGDESIIYSVSWAPSDMDCIVASTSKHGIFIWNMKKGCITQKIMDHGKGIYVYCVSWNQKDARKIASAGADGTCMIHQTDGKLINTFTHPAIVFGCDWNPKNEAIIATACEDGKVRIFYDGAGTTQPLKTFSGHTGKVFKVKWSPLQEELLCSTSDDCSVRIWNYSSGLNIRTLEGHTNYTRGLLWNPELPNVLLTGSWDYTIRVWDIRDGVCLDIIEDHGADVYGLACHPSRPFLFSSTSRDSTVRLWSLLPLVSSLLLKALVNRPLTSLFLTVDKEHLNMNSMGLYGNFSSSMKDSILKNENRFDYDILSALSSFFCPPTGVLNLWNLVAVITGKNYNAHTYKNGVVHKKHVTKYTVMEACEKELVKMTRYGAGGIGAPSKESSLRASAEYYIYMGNLKKYCEIKVELGEWLEALAIAPGISLEYWQELASRWFNVLLKMNSNKLEPLAIATGKIEELLLYYKQENLLDRAYIVTVAASEGLIKPLNFSSLNIKDENLSHEANYNEMIEQNASCRTEKYLFSGSPVLAACCQLAVDNVQETFYALLRGNEIELAVCLAMALNYNGPSLLSVVSYLSWRCAKTQEWRLAIDILSLCSGSEMEKAQICIHSTLYDIEKEKLYEQAGFPPIAACLEKASIMEAENSSFLGIVQYYLLSTELRKGLDIGLSRIKDFLGKPEWNLQQIWEVLSLMSSVNFAVLQDPCFQRYVCQLQIYCAYIGALKAAKQQFSSIVEPLLKTTLNLLHQFQNLDVVLTESFIEDKLSTWIKLQNSSKNKEDPAEEFLKTAGAHCENFTCGDIGSTFVSGSQLPRHSDQHNSYFHATTIQGPVFFLDSKSVVSLNDALMWAKVNKFSPLLSGAIINPF